MCDIQVRILDVSLHAYLLYLCCPHDLGREATARRRSRLRPCQTGRPGAPLRGRHPPHRGRARRSRGRLPHTGPRGAAPAGGRRADPALPEEGRPRPARLRAGDRRRRRDTAARRGARGAQGRTRARRAHRAPGGTAGPAEEAGRRRGPRRSRRHRPLLPRRDRPQRRQRDPLPPLRPAARPPVADGRRRHALPSGPHRQDPRRTRGDPRSAAFQRRGDGRRPRPPAHRLVLAPGPGEVR